MRLAIAACLLLAACGQASSPPKHGFEEQAVNERFLSLAQSARDLDHEAYLDHFDTDKLTVLNPNGTITSGYDQFRDDYLAGVSSLKAYQDLEFTKVSIEPLGENGAILVNEYEAKVELADSSVARFAGAGTQIWEFNDGVWKIVHVSSSVKGP